MTGGQLAGPRVQGLREHVLGLSDAQLRTPPEPDLLAARSWMASAGEPWTLVRRAYRTADIPSGLTPVIDRSELLVGKFSLRERTTEEQDELNQRATPCSAPFWVHCTSDNDRQLVAARCTFIAVDHQVADVVSVAVDADRPAFGAAGVLVSVAGHVARIDVA
jgi:hypothetical protein